MSPVVYQILHVFGALLVFLAYGLLIARAMLGSESVELRKVGAKLSGIGLLLLLVGGFGLLSKLYETTFYPWVIIKLVVWIALGGLIALINRKPQLGQVWYGVTLLLGLIAVSSVYTKIGM
jgi:hypothetical protein|tara:strand:- start:3836 stop:4198 length:363 start_codon:yes stop_codon:yes gene_type:complete